MRIRTAAITALATAALLTGCSSSSGSDTADSAAPTTTAAATPSAVPTTTGSDDRATLTAAVEAYTKDFFAPDAAGAFALLSARCQKTTSVTEMKQTLAASAQVYGKPAVKSTEVNQLAGDMARVTVHYVKPPIPEKPQSWTREGGQWRFDNC